MASVPATPVKNLSLNDETDSNILTNKRKSSFDNSDTDNKSNLYDSEKTPIKKAKEGEYLNIKLLLVAVEMKKIPLNEHQRNCAKGENFKYATIAVGTDGHNFMQIIGWGLKQAKDMAKHINDQVIGETFTFNAHHVSKAKPRFNLGSVDDQLNFHVYSSIKQVVDPDQKIQFVDPIISYYEFLANKHQINPISGVTPVKLQSLKGGENDCQVEVQIISVSDIQSSTVDSQSDFKSKVCNVQLAEGNTKAILSAWNTYAAFIRAMFAGKEGQTLIMNVNKVVMHEGFVKFTWNVETKYKIVSKQGQNKPTSLSKLISCHAYNKVELKVLCFGQCILLDQKKAQMLTLVTDGNFKAQLKYPADLELLEKEIFLYGANVSWSDAGVLTLTVHSLKDVRTVPNEQVQLKHNKKDYANMDLDYPPREKKNVEK